MEWFSLNAVVQCVSGHLSRVQSYFQFHCLWYALPIRETRQANEKQTKKCGEQSKGSARREQTKCVFHCCFLSVLHFLFSFSSHTVFCIVSLLFWRVGFCFMWSEWNVTYNYAVFYILLQRSVESWKRWHTSYGVYYNLIKAIVEKNSSNSAKM